MLHDCYTVVTRLTESGTRSVIFLEMNLRREYTPERAKMTIVHQNGEQKNEGEPRVKVKKRFGAITVATVLCLVVNSNSYAVTAGTPTFEGIKAIATKMVPNPCISSYPILFLTISPTCTDALYSKPSTGYHQVASTAVTKTLSSAAINGGRLNFSAINATSPTTYKTGDPLQFVADFPNYSLKVTNCTNPAGGAVMVYAFLRFVVTDAATGKYAATEAVIPINCEDKLTPTSVSIGLSQKSVSVSMALQWVKGSWNYPASTPSLTVGRAEFTAAGIALKANQKFLLTEQAFLMTAAGVTIVPGTATSSASFKMMQPIVTWRWK